MSTTIDEEVVSMKFDNSAFIKGVRTTMDALGALSRALKLDDAARGITANFGIIRKGMDVSSATKSLTDVPKKIDDISKAGSRFSLAPLGNAVEGAAKKFGALQIAGVTAIATIASRAVSAGLTFAKSFTTSPILDGLHEYETTLGSIQTIMANTGLTGQKGLNQVNQSLNELNTYSDKTIYNFTQMAKNIGTFTAAGVDLKTSTAAIKGIANLAAVSGSSADQASTAMYQLSQALASGTVKLMDWNSVVNAGMGGKVFQTALKDTARAHGVAIDSMIKKDGSFRESLKHGWLTSSILTDTLNKFTGDLTSAQLKKQGYTAAQIKGILQMGKTAQLAATQVKTFSQLVDTTKEAVGSGWTKSWQLILGDFGQAPKLFTGISNGLNKMINRSANARNKLLGDWQKSGGRTALIKGLTSVIKDMSAAIAPVKAAFREIFPPATGKQLATMTKRFAEIASHLKMGKDTADKVKRTFAGLFAIFSILGKVVGGVVHFFAQLFGGMAKGSGTVLDTTAKWGDWLVKLNDMIGKSGAIRKFFDGLLGHLKNLKGDIQPAIKFIEHIGSVIGNIFSGVHLGDMSGVTKVLDNFKTRLAPLGKLGDLAQKGVHGLVKGFKAIGPHIASALSNIGSYLAKAFGNVDYSKTLDTINTGLFAAIVLLIKRFLGKGLKINVGGGLFAKIKGAFGEVTTTLEGMQKNINASTIMKIAGAVAILAGSILVISLINSKELTKSMTAIASGLGLLFGTMMALSKGISIAGTAKLVLLSASMDMISASIVLLAGALKIMGTIPLGDMVKGIAGIGASLAVVAGAMTLMPKGMLGQAVAIGVLAVSLSALAGAIALFAQISWGDMVHGLVGIGGGLAVIAGAMHLMPKNMIGQAFAIGILALALAGLAGSIKLMSLISWGDMLHGLVGLGGALVVIAGAMQLMPKDMVLKAASLVLVAGAITVIGLALQSMGNMSWGEIVKGLVTLAGAMAILAGALIVMSGTLAGSAALVVAAAALAVLVPVITAMGLLPWSVIIEGLVGLAGIFTVLGLAGLLLAPLTPVILGLSAAILLIGAGMALAGLGALGFAAAFTAVTVAGAAGVAILGQILKTFIDAIPGALAAFGEGIAALARVIATHGPDFVHAFVTVLTSIVQSVIQTAPKVASAFIALVSAGLRAVVTLTPRIVRAGLSMITQFLKAIRDHISEIVKIVAQIIVNFVNAIAQELPSIIAAGVNLIISFMNGIADSIRNQGPQLVAAAGNIAKAIIDGMVSGLKNGVSAVGNAAANVAKSALNSAKHFLGIHSPSKEFEKVGIFVNQGFAKGLKGGSRQGVLAAFQTTADLLKTAYDNAVQDAKTAQAKLDKANAGKKVHVNAVKNAKGKTIKKGYTTTVKDPKAIAQAKADLAQANKEKALSAAAHHTLLVSLKKEEASLANLASSYEKVTDKLKNAQQALDDAKKVRDDYSKQIKDQYEALPDINSDTKLDDFRTALQKQIVTLKQFTTVLAGLRKLGLNDTLYADLLAKGPDALNFAQQLLASGSVGVKDFNTLTSTLDKDAASLGKTASAQMYQIGVDMAQGVVNGLKKEQAALQKQMNILADSMVAEIKKKLKIKSPSRVFAELGSYSVKGLAQGLESSSAISEAAATKVGTNTLEAMRQSIAQMQGMTTGMELNPTITPVLDLTDVQNSAKKIAGLMPQVPLSVATSYSGASQASSGYARNQDAAMATDIPAPSSQITYIQNNNSPKALSNAEIYRQTKNQLSAVRGVPSVGSR